jgi:hypothetical protein
MSVLQPVFEPQAPFGAIVARQLSVWPFAARTARLFLLVDPSLPRQSLRNGLLRAMQQAYFASDGYSQTRAVREAALAAHYVLRHHNRDVLPLNQVNAATAVAAVRGDVAFVALAGHAAAFAWRDGDLSGQRGILRLPRPLGLEHEPAIALWRTPLTGADRLVIVCGATWRPDSEAAIRAVLSSTHSTSTAERQLGQALGDERPASVLVIAPGAGSPRVPHLRLLGPHEPEEHSPALDPPRPARRSLGDTLSPRRWLIPALGLILLGLVAIATLGLIPQVASPAQRIDTLSPRMAVRLGAAAANVIDLQVGQDALYTLDVGQGAVSAFALDAVEQQPGPDSVLARVGTPIAGTSRSLAQPVAIEYLPDGLTIVDETRTVAQMTPDGLSSRNVPTSSGWQELGALGAGADGELLFVDSRAHQLLAYPGDAEPRLLLDDTVAPRLSFDRVAQVVATNDSLLVRLDDGTVHRFDAQGADQLLSLPAVNGHAWPVTAMTSDHAGGVFLADSSDARILETALDGTLVRELRAPSLAGVRAIDVSQDGQRLYALVATGVLVADIPAL